MANMHAVLEMEGVRPQIGDTALDCDSNPLDFIGHPLIQPSLGVKPKGRTNNGAPSIPQRHKHRMSTQDCAFFTCLVLGEREHPALLWFARFISPGQHSRAATLGFQGYVVGPMNKGGATLSRASKRKQKDSSKSW